jgi:NAD(P)H-nitrite reductase large subunit
VVEGSRPSLSALKHIGALWRQWGRIQEGINSMTVLYRNNIPFYTGMGILEAQGSNQVEAATIARFDKEWRPDYSNLQTIACDTICLGYGFVPFNSLSLQLGTEHVWRPDLGGNIPVTNDFMQTNIPGVYAVGDGAGIGGAALGIIEGQIAGIAAAAHCGHGIDTANSSIHKLLPALKRERRFQKMYSALFTPGPGIYELSQVDTIICRCEDVTKAKIYEAIKMGANSADEVKAISRAGLGNCQGRICGQLTSNIISQETKRSLADTGFFKSRPPIFPVSFEILSQKESNLTKDTSLVEAEE